MKGGEDGPVITAGALEKSKLIGAINYQNPDLQMPPRNGGGKLPDEQIGVLTEWVKMGAPWPKGQTGNPAAPASSFDLEKRRREHWAWQPIKAQRPPPVQNVAWPSGAPDRFILGKLEASHLQPAPPADRRTG